jgi:PAS domain S-box-containing protein
MLRSIRARLCLLVALTIVPLVAVAAYVGLAKGPIRAEIAAPLGVALAAVLGGLAASSLIGGRIASALRLLERYAEALGRGERPAMPAIEAPELERLATSLDALSKQAEAERRRLEAVLRTLPLGVLVADGRGQLVHANEEARRIWGGRAPLRSSAGYRARKADTSAPLELADWPIQRALRTGEPSKGELIEIERFDGRSRTILSNAAPIRDAEGRVVGAVAGMQDVTELRRAVARRDEVLQVVSHDLRTPLSSVALGGSALAHLPDGPASVERARAIGRRIGAAGRQMNRLIEDLRDLAGLDEGRLSIRPAPCEPLDLLGETADQLRDLARGKGLDLCLSAEPGLPPVLCDRDRILQVLGNLTSNAVNATLGGTVCLAAEARGGAVVFRVRDTGPGIPAEELAQIFDRFQRSAAAGWCGAELGLAISRRLVEAHGGTIWAESALGEGTTVSFTLPPAEQATRAAEAAPGMA